MSPYYIELDRPGEDGLSLLHEDYERIARASRTCGVSALPVHPDSAGELISADQGRVIADTIGANLPDHWPGEIVRDFLAFLRRGAFRVLKVAY